MKYIVNEKNEIDFGNMEPTYYLVGLFSEFMNRFQTTADSFYEEISWKQCFLLICLKLFHQPPTLKELSEVMGSSHQNVKQILIKLESKGYVQFVEDEKDKRKQRIIKTKKAEEFEKLNDASSGVFMTQFFDGVSREDLEVTIRTITQLDEKLKRIR